jgi:hypothetical protein
MAAYSLNLRTRAVRACDSGMPAAAVAARFDVSLAWVYRVLQRRPRGRSHRGNRRSFAAAPRSTSFAIRILVVSQRPRGWRSTSTHASGTIAFTTARISGSSSGVSMSHSDGDPWERADDGGARPRASGPGYKTSVCSRHAPNPALIFLECRDEPLGGGPSK